MLEVQVIHASAVNFDPAEVEPLSQQSSIKIHLLDELQLKFRSGARKQPASPPAMNAESTRQAQ